MRHAALALAMYLSACASQDIIAAREEEGCAACADAAPEGSYCEGEGPPVLVGDGAGARDVCSGEIAEAAFRFGLCTCAEYIANTRLAIASFDSREGPFTVPDDEGGSLGVNGIVQSSAEVLVGGDVVSSGSSATFGASLQAGGALALAGTLGSGAVQVAKDASVGGDIALVRFEVGGRLTSPSGANIQVSEGVNAAEVVRADVQVSPPCGCQLADLLDVAGYVEAHRNANNNAALGLSGAELNGYADGFELALPCGLYFFDRVEGDGALSLRIQGRVAMFIAGDLLPQGGLQVVIEPDAELDLFVAGTLESSGPLRLGSADAPAKARLYVGGVGAVNLSAGSSIGGNLYAPRADLNLSADTEVFGSLFVNRLTSAAPVSIFYDRAIAEAADTCID